MNVEAAKTDFPFAPQVKQLLAQMSLEEKIGQMVQIDFSVIGVPNSVPPANPVNVEKLEQALLHYHIGSILNTPFTPDNQAQPLETWLLIQGTIQAAAAKTRLKIPVLYGIDAVHGANYTKGATIFPQQISMAATFNPELSFKAGEITAREIRASGIPWNFAPVLDLGRQPLWPRLWETYGEDVHLASVMGKHFIQGHQGADPAAPDKALTCLKHYVGYSFPFNGQDRTPAYMGERTLREYFLPSFAAGIKAGAPTIMINSSEVDGIPGHANYHYLTTILRDELGFDGFTVSDWADIVRLYTRDKLAASEQEAVKMAVMAGVDMSMTPFDFNFYDHLLALVKQGDVPLTRIDEAVGRILSVKFRAGLFKPQVPLPPAGNFATPHAKEVNLQAAHEAIILAKNEQAVLPLKKDARILVTGPTANLLSVLNGGWTMTWQGDAEALYPAGPLTLAKALAQASTGKVTLMGGERFDTPINVKAVTDAAAGHEVIVLCLGEKPYTETLGNSSSLALDAAQQQLADAALATGKPVVVIMLGGRPRLITAIADRAQAVLLGFLPGMEGGRALADVLFGDYNPDGKLPISYPRHEHGFTWYDHKPIEAFESNIYNPLYPFGHGLSYTTFKTANLKVEPQVAALYDPIRVNVEVTNTGTRAGQETVLVYLHDQAASVSRPNKQLKAFQKVALAPGETRQLTFTLYHEDLSFIGVDLKRVVEPGAFTVMVGQERAEFTVKAAVH